MHRSRIPAALLAALALAAAAGPAAVHAQDTPVTLRLAVADGEGRPSDPYVHAFIDAVAANSGGSITVEPVWEAGADTNPIFEQGVAHLLVDGKADLALTAGRSWDDAGVTSLQALQAPFLITDDALALAVAASPIAEDMLAGMAAAGVTGLALWPEDLRHPVAFEPCTGPLVSPADFAGLTIRLIASDLSFEMIEALGATPIYVNGYDAMVESCEVQGAESGLLQGASLPGRPTFTGDVTFYPKYQVLAANSAALDRLSVDQQSAIRDAAIATRDQALAEHPSEVDAAAAWCADGGKVVHAGSDAAAAFQAAVQPVYDRLAADPVSGAAIDAITALKAATPAAPGAEACDAAPVASTAPAKDTTGYLGTALPDGVYRADITREALTASGAPPESVGFSGLTTLTITGSSFTWENPRNTCGGTLSVEASYVLFTWDEAFGDCTGTDHIQWVLDDDQLLMTDLESLPDAWGAAVWSVAPWTKIQ
ncbi:MAG: hypothetical protein LH650_04650 [Chloroflexi bacterium]|nr:hypothetical protein [Chloroflexota bacterium]